MKCYICNADAYGSIETATELNTNLFPNILYDKIPTAEYRSHIGMCNEHILNDIEPTNLGLCTHDWLWRFLIDNGACVDAIEWVRRNEYDLQTAWKECKYSGWLYWLIYVFDPSHESTLCNLEIMLDNYVRPAARQCSWCGKYYIGHVKQCPRITDESIARSIENYGLSKFEICGGEII